MEVERTKDYASKGMAGTALGIAIGAGAVELLRGGLGGILGGVDPTNAVSGETAVVAMLPALAALAGNSGKCESDHAVNRYEAKQAARIAELETEVKLRDANTYTDGKLLEVYQYVDGRLRNVEGQISQQAVYNATNNAALNCMQGQIAQLMSLTKLVVPNGSICPGWGTATVSVSAGTTTA